MLRGGMQGVNTSLQLSVANPLGTKLALSGAVTIFGSTSYCTVQVIAVKSSDCALQRHARSLLLGLMCVVIAQMGDGQFSIATSVPLVGGLFRMNVAAQKKGTSFSFSAEVGLTQPLCTCSVVLPFPFNVSPSMHSCIAGCARLFRLHQNKAA